MEIQNIQNCNRRFIIIAPVSIPTHRIRWFLFFDYFSSALLNILVLRAGSCVWVWVRGCVCCNFMLMRKYGLTISGQRIHATMAQLRSRITVQISRFLMIQNAAEDALEDDSSSVARHVVNTRLELLEANWTKFQTEHENLCHENMEQLTEESYMKHKTYERCQEFYVQAKATLLGRQEEIEASNPSSRASDSYATCPRSASHRGALPRIDLPKFSGDYHAWSSFHDLFSSMVGRNNELTNVEKMHYLKMCLSGDAARLVTNLPVSDDTFARAWKTLVARYENKRALISAQLDKLFTIKPVRSKSARELNTMITTVTELLGALQALGCQTNSWDPLLIHQLVRLLDEETRETWELRLGASTIYPTFRQFEEFLIGQARAWESLASQSSGASSGKDRSSRTAGKTDTKSRSLVATTSKSSGENLCPLCKSSHYITVCPDYLALSIQRRRRTIIKLSLCFNCLGDHAVNRCLSTRRCKRCGKKHHTTIHESFHQHKPPSTVTVSGLPIESPAPSLPSKSGKQ